ncbi:phage portal protein [Azotobacter salinestris]|uniref:phage portal protein n=1 Tax=Azotobacter salinestris TaxID=69964 RepID=UPI001266C7D0|nr:DUF1073 domain-containing protein [Azotobacter salinestris]
MPRKRNKPRRGGVFSTDLSLPAAGPARTVGIARDSALGPIIKGAQTVGVPDAQLEWYGAQSFIGYAACAVLGQHWLIDKACLQPARDALRHGYEITGVSEEVKARLRDSEKRQRLNDKLREFIHFGRLFGVRIALFSVASPDPEYYEKPFNPDGVGAGCYRGLVQVDPHWCTAELDEASLADPTCPHFYEPLYYRIGKLRIHRSHLAIFVPYPVPDLLKPQYQWGGVPLPQRIYERVYAAERTANEAPQLAMTKRLTALKTDTAQAMANMSDFQQKLQDWTELRDNYGVWAIDKEVEDLAQFDVSLADLDATIMTQYQLVAAVANVPVTKLMGTQVPGFNSSGEYEETSYREELESIQSNDLSPLIERHLLLCLRSAGIADQIPGVSWNPLDSPTAEEWAAINKTKAETAEIYAGIGAIDGGDVRRQLMGDPNSDWSNLQALTEESMLEAEEQHGEQAPAAVEQAAAVR